LGIVPAAGAAAVWVERGVVLRISGRITGDDREIRRTALDESGVAAIDLAEMELVDGDVVMFLAGNESSGIELSTVRPSSGTGSRGSKAATSALVSANAQAVADCWKAIARSVPAGRGIVIDKNDDRARGHSGNVRAQSAMTNAKERTRI
jgi:hypothetical protein